MTTLLSVPAKFVATAHTSIAATAFVIALFAGWWAGNWKKLCTNRVARWPVEWFPSVSAVIGDHASSRAPFHILIALCAGPRFLLLVLQWLSHRHGETSRTPASTANGQTSDTGRTTAHETGGARTRAASAKAGAALDQATEPVSKAIQPTASPPAGLADIELIVGLARTFCCGGWMYVTSRDSAGLHDMFMIVYLVLNLPWMYLSIVNAPTALSRRRRTLAMGGFLATVPPLVWMYYRHSVLKVPGAYTHYAFFEWSLVIWDIAFDYFAVLDLQHLQISVIDTTRTADEKGLRPTGFFLESSGATDVPLKDLYHDWTAEGSKAAPSPLYRAFLAWVSDVYLAICFWTVFTSLSVQLFYWSVWELALAGSELALLANLSAYTMSSPRVFRYVTSRDGLFTHRAFMVVGGMASWILPIPFARLVAVFIGTWTGWLALFGNWARLRGSKEMLAEGQVFGLGLAITMLLKYLNYSTNPFWCITDPASGGWNKTGLALGVLALIEYAYRPLDLFPAPPLPVAADEKKALAQGPQQKTGRLDRLAIVLGLGSFIHLVQTFLSDSGTIIAWTWTGFPITGPTLHPFAFPVIAVASLGVNFYKAAATPWWGILGTAGTFTLYTFPDWLGYAGGLALTLYLSALIPVYFRLASVGRFSSTWGHALLVNCLVDVVSVVTAAYAFVPLGWLVRERTDLVLVFTIGTIEWGRWGGSKHYLPDDARLAPRSHARVSRTKRWTVYASLALSVIAQVTSYRKIPTAEPELYFPEHRLFTAGIWTVHFGIDAPGRDSQWRMLDLIRDMQVDVVGLLETDLHRFVYGNRDLTRAISEELGYYVDLGPGPNKHTWGAALLSKFPILNSTHHLLPSPHGELAPAIHATLDIHGEHINVFVSHNGQFEDALDRELQTTEIARILRETEEQPTVFLGYLVTKPHAKRPSPYQILMEDGKMNDIEKADKWRWCEYIAFRGVWRIAFARVHESDISDTELQVGKFLLPRPGYPVNYKSEKEMYWHIGEKDIPEPWRMPPQFWNDGVRGHRYVKWVGPLYYLPPENSGVQRYGWDWATQYTS